jgi:hypothetical protein
LKLEIPQTCRYSLDTNSFVTSWQRTYPPDLFQPVWDHLDRLIHEERVIASSLVLLELGRKADEIHEWAKEREDGFIDLIEPLQNHVREIERRFPKLLKAQRNTADPFVIGTALLTKPHLFVVTEEGRGTGTENRPNIPFVCNALGVECRSFVEVLRETGFTFR